MPEEKQAKQNDAPATPKKSKKMLLIIAMVMGLEGVGVFFLAQMLGGGPSTATAAGEHDEHPATASEGSHEDSAEGAHASTENGHAAASPSGHEKTGEKGDKPEKGAKLSSAQSEIELPECRPSNKMSGKLILLRMRVSVLVATPQADKAKGLVDANKARITDRINFVVRSADPQHLNEPGLETIKRRIKQELDRILADDRLVQEVLVPELLQSGNGL